MEALTTMDYMLAPGAERSPVDESFPAKTGIVSNLIRLFATSTDALHAYLSFKDPSCDSKLDAKLLKAIALAAADVYHCDCCGSVHDPRLPTTMPDEIDAEECFESKDLEILTALEFARKIAIRKGEVSNSEFELLRMVGYSACDITKIVAQVALYSFSNCWNHVSQSIGRLPIDMRDSDKNEATPVFGLQSIQRLELSPRH